MIRERNKKHPTRGREVSLAGGKDKNNMRGRERKKKR